MTSFTYALNLSIDTIKELETLEKLVEVFRTNSEEAGQQDAFSAMVKSIREKSILLNCTIDDVRSSVRRMEI